MIVLNDVSDPEIGFESERNAVTLISAGGETEVPIASKDADRRGDPGRSRPLAGKCRPAGCLSGLY